MSGRSASRSCLRLPAVLVAAVLVLGACGGADDPGSSSISAAPAPAPAPATVAPAEPDPTELFDLLLTLEDVRPQAAFGLDIREQPVLDPQQFALATLRGPCGASVETPFADAGAFRVFRSTVSLIVEAVAQPGVAQAEAFVAELRANVATGCAPFSEQLGSAEPSTITLEAMLDLSALGSEWIGWTQEVADSTGRVGHRAILVAAEGDRLWLIAVLSPDPISEANLVALGELASQRAAGD